MAKQDSGFRGYITNWRNTVTYDISLLIGEGPSLLSVCWVLLEQSVYKGKFFSFCNQSLTEEEKMVFVVLLL